MAALAPLSTPARQPFGALDNSKLRSLQSIKNRQNAIQPSSGCSLKRRATSPEGSDSENVDPNFFDSMTKRKRASFGDDVSISKASRYNLTTIASQASRLQTGLTNTTPRISTVQQPLTTPVSAPAAAGRSPTRQKRPGGLLPTKRFAPPSFGIKSPSLSIAAALNGTIAQKKHKKVRTIEQSKPKSWFFDIFEESQEQQEYRMGEWTMTQSATSLDISDDEGKAAARADRGKENIDPNEMFAPVVTRSMFAAARTETKVSKKDTTMNDEPRSPLADLNPSEYYAEGLDATSVVLVHDDVPSVEEPETTTQADDQVEGAITSSLPETVTLETPSIVAEAEPTSKLTSASLNALVMSVEPEWDNVDNNQSNAVDELINTKTASVGAYESEPADIEIWESESAKDENENQESTSVLSEVRKPFDDENVFALQEL